MAPQTRPDPDVSDAGAPSAEHTVADLPPVLDAQVVTDVLHSVSDADTECELLAVPATAVAPPLPLDALEPLAGPREPQPTLPNLRAVGAAQATGSSILSEMVPDSTMTLRSPAPRHRPRTLPYGESEARAITASAMDESEAQAPRVLYEIPLPPRMNRPPVPARPDAEEEPTGSGRHRLSPIVQRLSQRRATPVSPGPSSSSTTVGSSSVDATRLLLPAARGRGNDQSVEDSTRDLRAALQIYGAGLPPSDEDDVDLPEVDQTDIDLPQIEAPASEVDSPEAETSHDIAGPSWSEPGPMNTSPILPTDRGALLALLLLGEAVILPGYRDGELIAPWTEIFSPGSATFTAATFFILLLVMSRLRLKPIMRQVAQGVLATAVMLFGYLLVGSAVGLDAFDGQPALSALFRGPVSLRVVLVVCACTLPTALLWHAKDEESPGARTLIVAGVVLVLFAYMALNRVGLGGETPAMALVDSGLGSLFLGDRLASWIAFGPGLVAVACLSVLVPGWRRWEPAALSGLFWGAVVAPLFLLALYVAPLGDWLLILEPLQVVSTLAAGLLLVPAAFSDLLVAASDVPDGHES